MLSSLLVTKSTIFRFLFDDIASHFNSGHCLSLLHLRNCPIAFTGKLQFDEEKVQAFVPRVIVSAQLQPKGAEENKEDPLAAKNQNQGKNAKRKAKRKLEADKKKAEKEALKNQYKPVLSRPKISELEGRIVHDQILSFDVSDPEV